MTFIAVCVRCGKRQNPTTLVDEGGELLLNSTPRDFGCFVSALCWRCEREQRASLLCGDPVVPVITVSR